MSDLFDKYGYVELSIGDLLWHENDSFPDLTREIFFLTDTSHAETLYGENLYEFIVKNPIKLLTPFKVSKQTRANSDFCQLYKSIYHNSTITNNVAIKMNVKRRRELIEWFKKQGIDGWVSPVQRNLYEVEVCIFKPIEYIEPNCKVAQGTKNSTQIKGIVGSCNKINVKTFVESRQENSQYHKRYGVSDYSIYDHYIL